MKRIKNFYCVDDPGNKKFLYANGELFFRGWFCDSSGNPANKIYAEIGHNVVISKSMHRPDVVDILKEKHNISVSQTTGFRGFITFGTGIKLLKIKAFTNDLKEITLASYIVYSSNKNSHNDVCNESDLASLYDKWVENFETFNSFEKNNLIVLQKALRLKPLISVLMPTYNTPKNYLIEVIDSVINQTYENWQLCISDDNSSEPHVKSILEEYKSKDPRIEVVYRKENGHISRATNSALEIAKGEFSALLDHDDLLPQYAFSCLVYQINQTPNVNLIYSDEDKIDENGVRTNPYFKPDWNYELCLSQNCISHLGVYRTSIIKEIGGFNPDLVGSQDWDMALRFIEKISHSTIKHIPHILYHWRAFENSTALSVDVKPYAVKAGKKTVQNHLKRLKINATVKDGLWQNSQKIEYSIHRKPLVSILIPTKNQLQLISNCIHSLIGLTIYDNFEILILDNGSDDPETIKFFKNITKTHSFIKLVNCSGPFNFSRINNIGVNKAKGEFICFLNDDIEITEPLWLSEMISHALRDHIGAVGAKLIYPQRLVQHSGIITGICGIAGHIYKFFPPERRANQGRAGIVQEMSAVTAACMVTPKVLFLEVNGFNEKDLPVAYNDVDYCLRLIAKGFKIIWTPYAELIHYESISRGYEDVDEQSLMRLKKEQKYVKEKWPEYMKNDPNYNPNLTNVSEDSSYAFPPRLKKFWQ